MSFTSDITKKALRAMNGTHGNIVIGFSGGADSSVLLSVLADIYPRENIYAVHINHMLRGADADADEEFCRERAKTLGVAFISKRIDVRALCGGVGFEEAARDVRYRVFSEIAKEKNAGYIALAHTASDNLETVLFNICRGSALSGVRGIPEKRACGDAEIIRPLLGCTRGEIIGYTKENGLSFVTDKTNEDTHYTRNYIRHKIVPAIKALFPSAEKAVFSLSSSVSDDLDFISGCARDFYEKNVALGKVKINAVSELHPAILSRVLLTLYGDKLEHRHIKAITDFIKKGEEGKISVPKNKYAYIHNGEFYISDKEKKSARPEFSYRIDGGITDGGGLFLLSTDEKKPCDGFEYIGKAVLPAEYLGEMTARSRVTQDKYRFYKMTRTVKKLLPGLSETARLVRPVICRGEDVIWFPGFPPSSDIHFSDGRITLYYYEIKKFPEE